MTQKVILASSQVMADALALKVPEFGGALVHIGFSDSRDVIKGADVLADGTFTNMATTCNTYIESGSPLNKDQQAMLDAEILAKTLYPPQLIELKRKSYVEWSKKQKGSLYYQSPTDLSEDEQAGIDDQSSIS